MYEPKPINTKNIELPDEIVKLTELLAKNSHDLWAKQRIAQGWTYGPERDDVNKKHPDLVPYDDLPESEKVYDRTAAMETLKTIIALGYRIEGSLQKPPPFSHEKVTQVIQRLENPALLDIAELHAIWRGLDWEQWASEPKI